MRRIPVVLLLCLGVALAGAAPPPHPAVKPNPAPSASALPQVAQLPIVVVFPFGTSTDITPGSGAKAADLFVQQMNAGGGIDTIGAPSTVKPADYLTYAKSVNADYYVSGYMTPLGTGVSLVEQVVSTRSGTMQFGQTAQIASFEDASAQAEMIHDSIVAREKSMQEQYQAAQATSTATPMPKGDEANLGQGFSSLANLFHHKGKTVAKTAPVDKPDKGVYVAHVNGSVPAPNLSSATSALYAALNQHYNAHMTNAPGTNLSRSANSICGTDRNNTIATGVLSAQSSRHVLTVHTDWTFKLEIYTCWGAKLGEQSATAGSLSEAINSAVSAYAKDHPQNG